MKKILIALSILATVSVALAGYVIVKNVTNDNKEYEVFTVTAEELAKGEYEEYEENVASGGSAQSYLTQTDKGKIALDYYVGSGEEYERYFEMNNYSIPSAPNSAGLHADFDCNFLIVNFTSADRKTLSPTTSHRIFMQEDQDPFTSFKNVFPLGTSLQLISSFDFYTEVKPQEKINENQQSQLIVTAEDLAKGEYEELRTSYGDSYRIQAYTLKTIKGYIRYQNLEPVSNGSKYFETSNFKITNNSGGNGGIVAFNFPCLVNVTYNTDYGEQEYTISVTKCDEGGYAYCVQLEGNKSLKKIEFLSSN